MQRLLRPSLDWLLVFVPISIAAGLMNQPVAMFITSALAIIPLAGLIGESTEQLAVRLGPRLGGLLNASLGNLTELIVGILLVNAGEFDLVKATLIGSIVGNLLLVLGLSFAIGGFRHKEQHFNAQGASVHCSSLLLAVAGLVVPALLVITTPTVTAFQKEIVSGAVALILIALYVASVVFTQVTHAHIFHTPDESEEAAWSTRRALIVLAVAAGLVGVESELLVSSLEPAVHSLGIPSLFVGLILIPVIGNAAEHASAVLFAAKNRVDLTIEIAIGSSTQVAMFVAPVLIFISLALSHPMDFIFNGFEIAIVGLSILIVTMVTLDGRSNWLEGAQLLGAYLVITAAAYFVGVQ